jgi:hypothetical protein
MTMLFQPYRPKVGNSRIVSAEDQRADYENVHGPEQPGLDINDIMAENRYKELAWQAEQQAAKEAEIRDMFAQSAQMPGRLAAAQSSRDKLAFDLLNANPQNRLAGPGIGGSASPYAQWKQDFLSRLSKSGQAAPSWLPDDPMRVNLGPAGSRATDPMQELAKLVREEQLKAAIAKARKEQQPFSMSDLFSAYQNRSY